METTAVLITGGSGFLGSHLAEFYLKNGRAVVCVDDFSTGLRSNRNYLEKLAGNSGRFQFIEADVSRPWSIWKEEIRFDHAQISHVFHFASPASPPHYQRLSLETMWVNTLGLHEAMLFADAQKARVIFASTSEIYGDPTVAPQPETYWGNVNTSGPRSCYDEAKRFGEALLYSHNQRFNTCHGLIRIFNTYGPRMNPTDGRVIINFLMQALRGERLSVYGNGGQTRSFCFVSDLIDGVHCYAHTRIREPVNLGNETEHSILDVAKIVQGLFQDRKIEIEFLDLPQDDPQQRRPDLGRAYEYLSPWKPRVQLKEGLEKMIQWLQNEDVISLQIPGRPQ